MSLCLPAFWSVGLSVSAHFLRPAAVHSETACSALLQKSKAEQATLASLTALPTHIARIKKTGKDHIICGALSSDGSRLAFSDQSGLHVYELPADAASTDDGGAETNPQQAAGIAAGHNKPQQVAEGQSRHKLMRLTVPEGLPTFHELHFRPQSSHLVGLTAQGSLLLVDMETAEV